jgi:hypothetical protein
MKPDDQVPEKVLYDIWKNQSFKGNLKTTDGNSISVFKTGTLNQENAGPDFKNARIKIGNFTYIGDVEIDKHYSDWKNHGHNIDNKYNSVVLHIFMSEHENNGYVYSRNGRKVPSICILDYVEKNILIPPVDDEETKHESSINKLKCFDATSNLENEFKSRFLGRLGVERFQKKSKRIFERLKEIQFIKELDISEPVVSYDLPERFHQRNFQYEDFKSKDVWTQLFYEMLFEALGYTQNKLQMTSLTRTADLDFFRKIQNDGVIIEKYEAALFKISGLLQTNKSVTEYQSKEYIERMELHWSSIKPFYDGKYFNETIWQFLRIRPQNFPTIRMAAGARLIKSLIYDELMDFLVNKIEQTESMKTLTDTLRRKFIISADGFWEDHFVFDKKTKKGIRFFIGKPRADEIIVNVILPFFAVYFEVFQNHKMVNKIRKLFSIYEQEIENQIVSEVIKSLGLEDSINRTVISQGAISLYRNYCSRHKCLECEIGKKVFD